MSSAARTVLLPCDDPEWSNFTKFFALHFADFGLAKLISTSYAPESNYKSLFYAPTLYAGCLRRGAGAAPVHAGGHCGGEPRARG